MSFIFISSFLFDLCFYIFLILRVTKKRSRWVWHKIYWERLTEGRDIGILRDRENRIDRERGREKEKCEQICQTSWHTYIIRDFEFSLFEEAKWNKRKREREKGRGGEKEGGRGALEGDILVKADDFMQEWEWKSDWAKLAYFSFYLFFGDLFSWKLKLGFKKNEGRYFEVRWRLVGYGIFWFIFKHFIEWKILSYTFFIWSVLRSAL